MKSAALDITNPESIKQLAELMGQAQAQDVNAMPVRQFAAEVLRIIKANPEATEIRVESVKRMHDVGDVPRRQHIWPARAFLSML